MSYLNVRGSGGDGEGLTHERREVPFFAKQGSERERFTAIHKDGWVNGRIVWPLSQWELK